MAQFRVVGEWLVHASSASEAENLVENAVAAMVPDSDLEDCNAELEDCADEELSELTD